MIPRLLCSLVLLVLALTGAGCVQIQIGSNAAALLMLIPVYTDDGGEMRNSNGAGTTYYNPRWYADPDSHPAVRPPPRKAAPETGNKTTP